MKTGISVYFSSGVERNEQIIERARRAKAKYAFTSMHIPEEEGVDYQNDTRHLLGLLRDAGMSLIVDVGPDTCEKLGCSRIENLRGLGITHIRLDYGFSPEETVRLSDVFHIVFNASTVTKEEIASWRRAGADFSRFMACHNFYPKEHTGLSVDDVRRINDRLSAMGFEIVGFVPGNGELRGPLCEGLPMIEEHRNRKDDVALNMLEAWSGAGCDVVLVGDPDLSDRAWETFEELSTGYVSLSCEVEEAYSYLIGQVHHDRPDSSECVMRSQESRTSLKPAFEVAADRCAGLPRAAGIIAVSNVGYSRYMGELEIARVDLDGDERVNVVGRVSEHDMRLLPYVKNGFGWKLVQKQE